MEVVVEDIVIVGAGIAGLTTSLGLHRLGIRSLVLESSETLRATGFAFTTWSNAWRALDALGIDKELEDNPAKMKQFVVSKCHDLPDRIKAVIENTLLDSIISSPLRYRRQWEVLWGNISKGNVCVAGDALHPMTPDIGQGGCAALEDGIVLARCIAEALTKAGDDDINDDDKNRAVFERIEMGLNKFGKERRWRSFELISTAYMVGYIQQSERKIMNFLRDKILTSYLASLLMKRSDFDCGKLTTVS
ncbi:hypothetical protein Dsin_024853 [Dipteronia sinensis]|uniref:FAD-binding domain-containing protein n=1 Tax=Dipteronia sinensis TaxID=43782 RepID=A0AAD9ZW85_9ROSI|nr:hypothetical protein Dsin_024853 [Dipteronia sinensis]